MRIRVVNPHAHLRPLLVILAVLLGLELLWRVGIDPGLDTSSFRSSIGPLPIFFAILFSLAILMRCQHMWWVLVYGACLGAGALAAPLAGDILEAGPSLYQLRAPMFVAFATLLVVGAPIGAGALLFLAVLNRCFFRRILIQDGSLCPTCAYCVSHLPTNECPECGNTFSSTALQAVEARKLPRGSPGKRAALTVVAAMVILAIVLPIARGMNMSPPWYAICDGRYRRYALASSPRAADEHRWLAVAMIEDVSRAGRSVSPAEVRSILGPPPLFITYPEGMNYLYFYQESRSRGRQEAYIEFADDKVQSVGWNASGVNDLSKWSPYVVGVSP